MNKGFESIFNERKVINAEADPFYRVLSGEYEFPENVNFQYSKDNCIALPYGYFASAMLTENRFIHIKYNGWEITLKGRNLRPLYNALIERKLKFVRRADEDELDNADLKTFVSHLNVKDLSETNAEDDNEQSSPPEDFASYQAEEELEK